MGDSGTETPNKRLKTDNSVQDHSSHRSGKGKDKLEHETNCCGICFSEAAAEDVYSSVSRGCIDSCDHYFCFVCIMEWAKVESKCPLCKRRFSTIRRPAKRPIFPSDRLIHVPVRNQAYDGYGNAITGTSDPYADAHCSVCKKSDDESLLLLCDLCDSSSHTYCVGLGATVPEGDWFCHECTLMRDEHNKSDIDHDSEGEESSPVLNESPLEEEHISISDIVSQPRAGTLESVDRISGQRHSQVFVNGARNNDALLGDGLNVSDSRRQALPDSTLSNLRRQEHAIDSRTKLAARTLSQSRDVHERIRALRNNWNSIRNGSLSFCGQKSDCVDSGQSNSVSSSSHNVRTASSNPTEPGNMGRSGSTSINSQPGICINSVQSSSSSSIQNREISISCRNASNSADPYDISKAWKMLGIAKKIERKTPPCLKNDPQLHLSKTRHIQGCDNLPSVRKGNNLNRSNGKNSQSMRKPQMLERKNHSKLESERNSSGSVNLPSRTNCGLVSSDNIFLSVQHESRNRRGGSSNDKISVESIHTTPSYCERSSIMGFSDEAAATAGLNVFRAIRETQSQQSSQQGPSVTKGEEKKPSVGSNVLKNCDAKSEIQSLVKLNLKLLTRAKKLETDVFKQVARSATHSILAACGLEYLKPGSHQFSSSVCSHEETDTQFRRSTLMPNSCRECFYAFVKDVVNSTLIEKAGESNLS